MASRPPTEADFAAFRQSLKQRRIRGYNEAMAETKARFPDRDDRFRYIEWAAAQSAPAMIRDIENRYQCPSTKEFINCVKNTPYNNLSRHVQLVQYLEGKLVPLVLVGKHDDYIFRLAPAAYLLKAHKIPDWEDPRTILAESVLGVNSDVEASDPTDRRGGGRTGLTNLSEESTTSTESDDVTLASGTASGFVFHQLGNLEALTRENWEGITGEQQAYEAPWVPTGFCVVVRINADGSAGEIWVMYNFFPFDAEDERYHVYTEDWGYLPDDEPERANQFSCAKIADSIDEFEAGYQINWQHKITHEPELVRVVHSGNFLLRQSIAEPRG